MNVSIFSMKQKWRSVECKLSDSVVTLEVFDAYYDYYLPFLVLQDVKVGSRALTCISRTVTFPYTGMQGFFNWRKLLTDNKAVLLNGVQTAEAWPWSTRTIPRITKLGAPVRSASSQPGFLSKSPASTSLPISLSGATEEVTLRLSEQQIARNLEHETVHMKETQPHSRGRWRKLQWVCN